MSSINESREIRNLKTALQRGAIAHNSAAARGKTQSMMKIYAAQDSAPNDARFGAEEISRGVAQKKDTANIAMMRANTKLRRVLGQERA